MTGRAIERASGGSHGGVQRALEHLVAEGIVTRERAGRAYLYRLNRDHLAARWIEGLASLRLELIERLRETVAGWELAAAAVVLFGSVARGEAGRVSDIDLLVVRPTAISANDPLWREQVSALESAAAAWTGNDARMLEYGVDELADGEPVLDGAAVEGIEVYGSLRRLLQQAHDAAETIREVADDEADSGDAYVTLLVHAGIAAADAICCQELGEHAQGESHTDAIALLRRVRPDGDELASALASLLGAKTRAGYGHQPVNEQARVRSTRAAEKLLRAARDRHT